MTNTTVPDKVLKTDVLGRVRTPVEQREALLEEFARSGVSGKKFAALVGVNYQTFASWVQKRRKAFGGTGHLEERVIWRNGSVLVVDTKEDSAINLYGAKSGALCERACTGGLPTLE